MSEKDSQEVHFVHNYRLKQQKMYLTHVRTTARPAKQNIWVLQLRFQFLQENKVAEVYIEGMEKTHRELYLKKDSY